jgi:hypothetical protein
MPLAASLGTQFPFLSQPHMGCGRRLHTSNPFGAWHGRPPVARLAQYPQISSSFIGIKIPLTGGFQSEYFTAAQIQIDNHYHFESYLRV